eukprot:3721562-Pyramimonas_sp.AAC.1
MADGTACYLKSLPAGHGLPVEGRLGYDFESCQAHGNLRTGHQLAYNRSKSREIRGSFREFAEGPGEGSRRVGRLSQQFISSLSQFISSLSTQFIRRFISAGG